MGVSQAQHGGGAESKDQINEGLKAKTLSKVIMMKRQSGLVKDFCRTRLIFNRVFRLFHRLMFHPSRPLRTIQIHVHELLFACLLVRL